MKESVLEAPEGPAIGGMSTAAALAAGIAASLE